MIRRTWLFVLTTLLIAVAGCSAAPDDVEARGQSESSDLIISMCTSIVTQVCGANGVTYQNGCYAQHAGQTVVWAGACPGTGSACGGGTASTVCAAGSFCRTPLGSCGASAGTCVAVPPQSACNYSVMPACGCHGESYVNDCWAENAGASLASLGDCPVGGAAATCNLEQNYVWDGKSCVDREIPQWPVPTLPLVATNYTVSGGTILDKTTGLMWQSAPTAPMAWADGKLACRDSEVGGNFDWRMPTLVEMMTIVDYSKSNVSLAPGFTGWSGPVHTATPSSIDAYGMRLQIGPGNTGGIYTGPTYCVRSTRKGVSASKRFFQGPTGQVIDSGTGLTWMTSGPVNQIWEATATCNALGAGWHVPTVPQLAGIVPWRSEATPFAWGSSYAGAIALNGGSNDWTVNVPGLVFQVSAPHAPVFCVH